jgi:zinc transport system permease protein
MNLFENIFSTFLASSVLMVLSASVAALMSSLVLWKKLSYFGDAISHSSLLAVVLGTIIGIEINIALPLFAIIFASLVWFLQNEKTFLKSNATAVSAYFCISCAMIFGRNSNHEFDFDSLIFGDFLAADWLQIMILIILLAVILLFLAFCFRMFVLAVIAPDLAKIEGIKTNLLDFFFLIILAVVSAILAKAVGILLTSALLVLPGLIARKFSSSPLQMVFNSLMIGIVVSVGSIIISESVKCSVSALMIFVLCLIFFGCLLLKRIKILTS